MRETINGLNERQHIMIGLGYQKYRFNFYKDKLNDPCHGIFPLDKVESMTCLICNTVTENPDDIKEQYCPNCKKHHYTPS